MPVTFRPKTTKISGRAEADPSLYEILKDLGAGLKVLWDAVLALFVERVNGTPGRIAKFIEPNAIGDSVITEDDGHIGINETAPLAVLHVSEAAGSLPRMMVDGYGVSAQLVARVALGTKAAPTAVTTSTLMGGFAVRGYGATRFTAGARAYMIAWAAENWTDAANGTYWTIATTPIGSAGAVEAVRILPSQDIIFAGGFKGFRTKALTESADTGYVDISVATGETLAGECVYAVEANDATDFQSVTSRLRFVAVNKAGTVTVTLVAVGTQATAVSAGTLTVTNTALAGAGKITLRCNAASSLAQTTLAIRYRVDLLSTAANITPL